LTIKEIAMFPFPDLTIETAPEAARPALKAAAAQLGFLPAAMARQAVAPELASTFARLLAIWNATELDHREREVVTFVMAHETGCELCLALHSQLVHATIGDAALLDALRANVPLPDARLEAIRTFTRAVLAGKGAVDDATMDAFLAAGHTPRQALEVVLGIATYTLSTYANRLVRAPVDAPLAAWAA
jgi:AhpD family alkylhydroperoxidase